MRVAASAGVSTARPIVSAGTGPPVAHSRTPTAVRVDTSGTPKTAIEPRSPAAGRWVRQSANAISVMPIDHSASSGVPIT